VRSLVRLERDLGGLKRRADAIDLRMAAFNRLSQQRYRYQTELRGRRPELVKAYCQAVNRAHAGTRFSDLAGLPADFPTLCIEAKFFYGTESLYKPRRVKAPVDLSFAPGQAERQNEDDVLAAWKERQRLALTPQRAARLVSRLIAEKGGTASTEEITLETADDLLDLLAAVAYEQSPGLGGKRVRWSVDGPRRGNGLEPDKVPMDDQSVRQEGREERMSYRVDGSP
jgi:hypothetical protein